MLNSSTAHSGSPAVLQEISTLDAAGILLTFWKFLLSSPTLREGTRILFFGGILEGSRRLAGMVWQNIVDFFFITAEFEDRDETFTWMMFWLSRQPKWNKLRSIRVTTFRYGHSGVSDVVPGEIEERHDGRSRRLAYNPSHNKTISLWYRGTWMKVKVVQTQGDMWNRRGDERLIISLCTRKTSKLDELLLEAKRSFKKHSEGRINIYVSDTNNDWTLAGSRPRRRLSTVVLGAGIKERLLADAKDFIASENWYADRGIPWRRGYLFHGSPGSGKTSLIHCLAGELGLDIYVVSLSKKSLDDSTLNELISKLPPKSIALMEDIDAAFLRGITRENDSLGVPPMPGQSPGELVEPSGSSMSQMPMQAASSVTLSGLLAAIDGVAAQEGRLLFATTNKYNALDPALIRPGRLDVHVRFENAGKRQAAELFCCFFLPDSGIDEGLECDGQATYDSLSETSSPTAVNSPVESPRAVLFPNEPSNTMGVVSDWTISSIDTEGPRDHHPAVSRKRISHLAHKFADQISEGEFSMAALQGLLMQHKTEPYKVLEEVETWIMNERRNRAEREGKVLDQSFEEQEGTQHKDNNITEELVHSKESATQTEPGDNSREFWSSQELIYCS
ncbi:P-loop containing nucleoside triphosphate hydrolase protein [Fomitiporia mediterranea MF3/22]|uniref:P-loop containing nucleoside triphosphate hydrolase protein n=1 Tax=Fomitiporia mediterranea (strain MF3/22) TaxID=694068 RepID=UPI0004409445|nr:P-loop containing nucleoside triphosphate hydrolase protein [Fomitiporia mediterranea MF3/22]EJC99839.1 P-loop containing nucleoside triphosphate hydrolase protein [Fomitiporia mediterranea MF3/22]